MPHFALVLSEDAVARKGTAGLASKTEAGEAAKLESFRERVLSKSSKIVDDPRDIKIGVLQSLHEIELRPGLVGWLRSNEIRTDPVTAEQMAALADANRRLRESLELAREELETAAKRPRVGDLLPLESPLTITVEARYGNMRSYAEKRTVNTTWRALFSAMAIKLLAPTNDETLNQQIARELEYGSDSGIDCRVSESDWEAVKAQFLSLGYVDINYGATVMKTGALFWTLTDLGKEIGLLLRSARVTSPAQ